MSREARKEWTFDRSKHDPERIPECSYLGDTLICLAGDYENAQQDCLFVERAVQTHDELVAALDRANRLIDAMAYYVGKMAIPAERLADLNHHWIEVPGLLKRAADPVVPATADAA